MLSELRDEHITLSEHNADSRRGVPSATDIWAQWIEGAAVVTAVRAGSVADVAGLHPGIKVAAVQGVDIERADAPNGNGVPLVARRIGEERDLGCIRLKNNLHDAGFVAHFDAALAYLKDTRAMILDLRETQSGGSPAVARAILGRFIQRDSPWKARAAHGKAPIVDSVAPRGPFAYRAPLVVLVDRWTAGEGEALAVGLESASNATLLGTAMAGLRGELREVALRHTGITARFPAEKSFRIDGTPREAVRPTVLVDLERPSGGPGDPILYQALKYLETRNGAKPR